MPKLLLKFNAAVIKEIPIAKNTLTVGRKDDNDIVIDNPAVSGHHCKIFLQGDGYFVEDLNSTNGTFVNEKKIIRAGLKTNDVVGIVKHALVFVDDRPGATTAPAPAAAAQAPAQTAGAAKAPDTAILSVVEGVVDKPEYEIKGMTTYIGKSDKVQIPIKGMMAPEVAAMVAKRPEGYYLIAVKPGYPKLNGAPVQEREILKDGDTFEISGSVFRFGFKK
ncbi:MAG: FHA domain-containing protein [Elusimicrobia bacterium]|nr:FHA domain-containing protein [Elusimicrobiota bacterium]